MRRVLIILFCSLCFLTHGQGGWKVAAVGGGSVALAIGDGLNDSGHKDWGHLVEAIGLGAYGSYGYLLDKDSLVKDVMAGVFVRYGVFDPSYNLTRGLPVGYTGNTSYPDKILRKFNPPEGMKMFTHGLSLVAGISLILRL